MAVVVPESLDGVEDVAGEEVEVALVPGGIIGGRVVVVVGVALLEERGDKRRHEVEEGDDAQADDDGHQEVVGLEAATAEPAVAHVEPSLAVKRVASVESNISTVIGKMLDYCYYWFSERV